MESVLALVLAVNKPGAEVVSTEMGDEGLDLVSKICTPSLISVFSRLRLMVSTSCVTVESIRSAIYEILLELEEAERMMYLQSSLINQGFVCVANSSGS